MKACYLLFYIALFGLGNLEATIAPNYAIEENGYVATYCNPLPKEIEEKIKGNSWKEGCPVPLDDLAYVLITHWNFQGEKQQGEFIVHKKIAREIVEIFYELFLEKFPIHQARLIEDYDVNDDKSMLDNNSSAFCSRSNLTFPGQYSKHSYGLAIDINPKINPYYHIEKDNLQPESSGKYLDRSLQEPGMIDRDTVCYHSFVTRGFDWGGEKWDNRVDYHHFEKDPGVVLER